MKGFNLTHSNHYSLRTAAEFNSLKRSAKSFSFKKKACLNFPKTPRHSHDHPASSPAPSPPQVRARANTIEFLRGDDVICISREDSFDSRSRAESSPSQLQTPSHSPYPSIYSSPSSSSSSHFPTEIEDREPSTPVDDEIPDGYDPRRGSQLSIISSWVDHHLQELDLSYCEDGVYEIEIVTTPDDQLSRRDSFILPPGETFQSLEQKRNLPIVPPKQLSRMSRPLPSAPVTTGFQTSSRPIRPLPPPPSPW